jgi:hypothetical protein
MTLYGHVFLVHDNTSILKCQFCSVPSAVKWQNQQWQLIRRITLTSLKSGLALLGGFIDVIIVRNLCESPILQNSSIFYLDSMPLRVGPILVPSVPTGPLSRTHLWTCSKLVLALVSSLSSIENCCFFIYTYDSLHQRILYPWGTFCHLVSTSYQTIGTNQCWAHTSFGSFCGKYHQFQFWLVGYDLLNQNRKRNHFIFFKNQTQGITGG